MLLIYVLILLFTILIAYQINLAFSSNVIVEGLQNSNTNVQNSNTKDYQPYNLNDPNNSLILSQQNAGNIEVLNGRMDDYSGVQNDINNKVVTMQQSIDSMQTQLDGLVQQQANYAQDIAGSAPVEVTGTDVETTDNVESDINGQTQTQGQDEEETTG